MKYCLAPTVLSLALAAPAATQWPPPLYDSANPARACASLTTLELADATIESASVEAAAAGPPYCRVTAVATHSPANDRVTIWVALPLENWNGRFLGTGGGGFSGGSPRSLPGAVREGFAAAATDTGHEENSGSFALGPDDAFAAVVRWVEEGVAPETLAATRRDENGDLIESRPICRYPKVAIHSGSGELSDAASFECREEVLDR